MGGNDNATAFAVFVRSDEADALRDRSTLEMWSPAGKLEILIINERVSSPTLPQEASDRRAPPVVPPTNERGPRKKGRGRSRERAQGKLPMDPNDSKLSIEVKKQTDAAVIQPVLPRVAGGGSTPQAEPRGPSGEEKSRDQGGQKTPDCGDAGRPNSGNDGGPSNGGSTT